MENIKYICDEFKSFSGKMEKSRTSLLARFIFLGINVYLGWEVILKRGRKK